jgi:hypothetical protein
MNMNETVVKMLIGDEVEWENLDSEGIAALSLKVLGGSTKKPTSAAKKEEALEFGQVLGQFVNAAPGPVIKMMMQVMEKAFDEVTMREEDWQELQQALEQQQQQQQGGGGAPQQPPQPQPEAQPEIANASPEQLQQVLGQLPPEIKQQVQSAIQSGVPPAQALESAIKLVQQQGQQAASPQPTQPLQ